MDEASNMQATGVDSAVPPDGFVPLASRSPFIQALGAPLFERLVDPTCRHLTVRVAEQHCNADGHAHGGFIVTIADFALTYGTFREGDRPPAITLHISTDFMRPVRLGDWLEVVVSTRKQSENLLFADALILAAGEVVARASGVFRPMRRSP